MSISEFDLLMVGVTLLAVTLGIVALMVGLFYYAWRLSDRVSGLENKWDAFRAELTEQIKQVTVRPGDAPGGRPEGDNDQA